MKTGVFIALLYVVVAMSAFPQQGADRRRQEAIERALREIAIKDHTIPNVIYNGMTIEHVESILEERVSINFEPANWPFGYQYVGYHGTYAIFWSGMTSQRPVVVGYASLSDRVIRSNVLR